MQRRRNDAVKLAQTPGGAAAGLRTYLRPGRFEVSTAGADTGLQLVGGDPWGAPDFMGLLVPQVATPDFQHRYLFLLARAQFNNGERVRLVGWKQYLGLFGFLFDDSSPPVLVETFEKQVTSPAFRFKDANVSWHIMILSKVWRDTRNAANADSLIFQDATSPALLFQALAPYVPPNAGRPWGKTVASDLGNVHDMRVPWRDTASELSLDIPIPAPCDVALFASVAQTNQANQPTLSTLTTAQAAALDSDWAFAAAFTQNCSYGRVAGALIFQEEEFLYQEPAEND